jgi:hypothetical protein
MTKRIKPEAATVPSLIIDTNETLDSSADAVSAGVGSVGPNGIRVALMEDGTCAVTMYIDGIDRFWVSYNKTELDNLIVVLQKERKNLKAAMKAPKR